METFAKLFERFLVFVYHCFDRIVIQGYLPLLTRPAHIVHFFRDVHGQYPITPQVLAKRTNEYRAWVEAYARNHAIPIQWAEKDVRKKNDLLPWLRPLERSQRYGGGHQPVHERNQRREPLMALACPGVVHRRGLQERQRPGHAGDDQ